MTIDLKTVKAGDKLHTRQGDVLVVRVGSLGGLYAAGWSLDSWCVDMRSVVSPCYDIIRIEKHEPVVEVGYFSMLDTYPDTERVEDEPIYKITITDGVPSIEKVE